jgi:predicted cupin superfamily sugar epimerase
MKCRPTADELISHWQMQRMETENIMFSQSYVGEASTAIIAMLTDDPESFSDMHRLPTDEIWHFYMGDAIELLLLDPSGKDEVVILGQDVLQGEHVQFVVPAGVWMGARIRPGGDYAVFGNTMAPGFSVDDFEGAAAADLISQWPQHAQLIRALT